MQHARAKARTGEHNKMLKQVSDGGSSIDLCHSTVVNSAIYRRVRSRSIKHVIVYA